MAEPNFRRAYEAFREAVAAGQHAFGENYVQDALEKIDALLGHPTVDPHGDPIPRADGELAAMLAALPKAERQAFKPGLLALIDGLNRLVGQIEAQHGEMSAALQGVASRRNAVSAYGKGAGAGGGKPSPPNAGPRQRK